MAKIPILGEFNSVTASQILAVAEQIKYRDTTVAAALDGKQGTITVDSTDYTDTCNVTVIPAV